MKASPSASMDLPRVLTGGDSDFSYLEQAEFRAKYVLNNQMRFYVKGMSCSKCVRKLEEIPLALPGLRSLRVELGKNLAHAEIDPLQIGFSKVAEKIKAMGFEPIPLTVESNAESLQKRADQQELIRLAIAGACAGNIMTFSFAFYLGAGAEWGALFSWLSFALYIPVLTYVAWPFYVGAWSGLKRRQISIDLPMTIASVAGFLFSFMQLLRGREDIYFDSLSGFLFLILVSRWAQKRVQKRALRPEEFVEWLRLERVRVVGPWGWSWSPVDQLRRGDRIELRESETLPADAELESGSAHFSMAWLSGEAKPKTFHQHALIPAGARLLSGEVHLSVRRPLSETAFGQILREVQSFSLSQNQMITLADKWSQWLLSAVFLVALFFLFAYWSVSAEEAIRRALALIILACPCAMAFGTPLALSSGLAWARRRGLIVRDANVLSKTREVKTLFLDKTGTLTDTELALITPTDQLPSVYRKIILALENSSMHPIAFAFRKAFSDVGNLPPVEGARETAAVGVSGFVYGKFYELRRPSASATEVSCVLFEDKQEIMNFEFSARIKPGTENVLNDLRARGLKLKLLSGDSLVPAQRLGRELGFLPEDIEAQADPARKMMILSQSPSSMMVGDGFNDSLALSHAHVGVAVSGGMEAALRSSGVYLLEPGLQGLADLFDVSERTHRLIRGNLTISLFYNVIGGALALCGFINPLIAALLMPLSSLMILLTTWSKGGAR